jgi:hypothetical protein
MQCQDPSQDLLPSVLLEGIGLHNGDNNGVRTNTLFQHLSSHPPNLSAHFANHASDSVSAAMENCPSNSRLLVHVSTEISAGEST